MERPKSATDQAIERMENPVEMLSFLPSLGEAAQVSTAISLKRIADALERISECADGIHPSAFRVVNQG